MAPVVLTAIRLGRDWLRLLDISTQAIVLSLVLLPTLLHQVIRQSVRQLTVRQLTVHQSIRQSVHQRIQGHRMKIRG